MLKEKKANEMCNFFRMSNLSIRRMRNTEKKKQYLFSSDRTKKGSK